MVLKSDLGGENSSKQLEIKVIFPSIISTTLVIGLKGNYVFIFIFKGFNHVYLFVQNIDKSQSKSLCIRTETRSTY